MQVTGLRKAYGDRVVLDDVDLSVERHDVICLIGASGSGKSTLLRCLNLLEVVDDGQILLEGDDIDPTGAADVTAPIQQRLDAAPDGAVVAIPAGAGSGPRHGIITDEPVP